MEWVLGIAISAALGWLIDGLFWSPFRGLIQEQMQLFIYRYIKRPKLRNKPEEFRIGGLSSEWVVIEGDATFPYNRDRIKCFFRDTCAQLPPEVSAKREILFQQRADAQARGEAFPWCSKIPRLLYFKRDRTDYSEYPVMIFHFGPSDYYTFLGTSLRLDEEFIGGGQSLSIRQKYLKDVQWDQPVDFLAHSFGVYIAIITEDGFVILVERSEETISRREYSVSVTEGMTLDRDIDEHGNPDPFKTAVRGAWEELGVMLHIEAVEFLSFGVTPRYYQYALLGRAKPNLVNSRVENRHSSLG